MGFFDKLFPRKRSSEVPPEEEHAILLYIPLSDDQLGTADERDAINALASQLEAAVESASLGEYDGNEFGEGRGTLFIYGRNADAMFDAIEPIVRASPLCRGARAVKRYGRPGDPKAKHVEITL